MLANHYLYFYIYNLTFMLAGTQFLGLEEYWAAIPKVAESNLIRSKKSFSEFTNILENQAQDKVAIHLYYESRCPSCRMFDTNTLIPTIKKLGDLLDVYVYPYGKANTTVSPDGTVHIKCQHGPDECYGNMLHACAIRYIQNYTEAIFYNGCMMDVHRWQNGGSDNQAADECASTMNIDSKPIKKCAASSEGLNLLKFYGDESKKIGYHYVPHILVNGKHSTEDNFFEHVCNSFKQRPPECDLYRYFYKS